MAKLGYPIWTPEDWAGAMTGRCQRGHPTTAYLNHEARELVIRHGEEGEAALVVPFDDLEEHRTGGSVIVRWYVWVRQVHEYEAHHAD